MQTDPLTCDLIHYQTEFVGGNNVVLYAMLW